MAMPLAYSADRALSAPQIVAGPRRTDAVGDTLRQAFRSSRALPEQWRAALRRLDSLD